MSVRGGILIGGLSKRMGSPKHLLEEGGLTFAERLLHALMPHVDDVTFLGKGTLPTSLSHCPQLEDAPELQGPLSGILAGLRFHEGPWLIVACDLPRLTSNSIHWLLQQRQPGISIIMPQDARGLLQPHFSLFESNARDSIEEAVAQGLRAPKGLAKLSSCLSPTLPEAIELELANMNLPSDLRMLEGTR